MKKISKDDDARLNDLAEKLRAEWLEVEGTKDAIDEALARYNEAVVKYNEIVGEARELVEELGAKAQEYADERSERWADSDNGANYMQWISDMQLDLEDIEEVENLELAVDPNYAEALDGLPREPDE